MWRFSGNRFDFGFSMNSLGMPAIYGWGTHDLDLPYANYASLSRLKKSDCTWSIVLPDAEAAEIDGMGVGFKERVDRSPAVAHSMIEALNNGDTTLLSIVLPLTMLERIHKLFESIMLTDSLLYEIGVGRSPGTCALTCENLIEGKPLFSNDLSLRVQAYKEEHLLEFEEQRRRRRTSA